MLVLEPYSVSVVIPKLLTLLVSLVAPVVTGPDEMREENTENVITTSIEAPADTILRPNLDLPAVAVEVGLSAMQAEPHVTLGMRRIRVSAAGVGTPRSEGLAQYRGGSRLSYRMGRGRRMFSRLGPGVGVGTRLVAPSPLDVVLRARANDLVTSGRTLYLPTETRRSNPIIPSDESRFVTELSLIHI